MGLSNI